MQLSNRKALRSSPMKRYYKKKEEQNNIPKNYESMPERDVHKID